MTERPILAVTVGDPVGIGPEITVRTLADVGTGAPARGVVVADPAVLRRAVAVCGLDLEVRAVGSWRLPPEQDGVIDCYDIDALGGTELEWGTVDARAGAASVRAIEVATAAAMARDVSGIVTGPINKEAIWAAGSKHLGHTEMLGELTGATRQTTMFVVRGKKIFFATRHLSLRKALDQINEEQQVAAIEEALTALRVFGDDEPRLAVAAINPHGGENGAFGDEEILHLAPAVKRVRATGADVTGPVPADSVFHQLLTGRYDGVLSQYHDQGHIAAKTFDFDGTISVTVGLPILRTSVDHGTAFDIAGRGIADPGTMRSAFLHGAEFAHFADRIRAAYGTGS
ncbi:4-hydroxythreonine-4-phosphate dehydrogenase PdxA [Marinitenerispora sediminis]|uniref:4-hydroxythreonine-4-phosphate dehydrogenase PdxA n=1 Tax=Marinitenerispora sediminis TaxID=1931232 RepID=A0A368TBV9_9ACTN|nr:4-hydroxythreonine-4-phosphate dehydrogenase PdxA [Marinitenerispora sediminis]RCV58174.1 4-hydroxythreonine-4-phosphate dehydrogenase PdxA [Marinitenerispora sediminis]RCV61466.1 4-hydroxythreonine-4-phosphate dehydrogenase PdxA [Marinitenerispora sediminis]RCV62545.1 4-hydroxythreonine-4-phosphate dehydrogenase PdxA [Marinitenerispora sediminis]